MLSTYNEKTSTRVLTCQVSTDVLNRAERTPGVAAVSQVIQSSARAAPKKAALATCQANSELPFSEGGSFIGRPGGYLELLARMLSYQ